MSTIVSLEIKPRDGAPEVSRAAATKVVEALRPQKSGLSCELVSEGSGDIASIVLGGPQSSFDDALRVAFAIADGLGWAVFDNERGAYVPRSELDESAGLRPALSTLSASLGRESRAWLVRRFLFHLVPRDALSIGFYLLVGSVSAKVVNLMLATERPIWAEPGLTVAVGVVVFLIVSGAVISVLGETRGREMERRAVQQGDAADGGQRSSGANAPSGHN
jgi:hypothetical protein